MSVAGPTPVKWTKSQFLDLFDQGFLDRAKRYELLEGDILERMSPIGLPHSFAITELSDMLRAKTSKPYVVFTTASVAVSPDSMLEPDLFVLSMQDREPGARFAEREQQPGAS